METLLIHKSHLSGGLFHKLIDDLKQNNVKVKLYKPPTILNPFRIFVEPGKMGNCEFDPITIIVSLIRLQIHIGPRLSMLLPVSPTPVNDFSVEYGSLDCNVEVVDSLQDAVQVNSCRVVMTVGFR